MKKIILLATLVFSISNQTVLATMPRGIQGRQAGDIIALSTDSQIAAYCNFNTQIVVTQTNVLCVYNGVQSNPEDE